MQQINLYQAQFKPKNIVLPARQLFLLILFAIIIFIVMAAYSIKTNSTLEAHIASQQQNATLAQQSAPENDHSLLKANLFKLQQQAKTKQTLLTYLTKQSVDNQQGFTNNLVHLSQQQIDGVWLTEFSFIEASNYVSLHGSALQSSQIPLYIDSLAETGPFQGKHFSVFSLQSPKQDSKLYTFKLHTDSKAGQP